MKNVRSLSIRSGADEHNSDRDQDAEQSIRYDHGFLYTRTGNKRQYNEHQCIDDHEEIDCGEVVGKASGCGQGRLVEAGNDYDGSANLRPVKRSIIAQAFHRVLSIPRLSALPPGGPNNAAQPQ